MNKRLRKKRHFGEFREWGVPLAVRRTHPDGFDDVMEDFLEQAIEAKASASGAAARGSASAG